MNAVYVACEKVLLKRTLGAELSQHLGYPLGTAKPEEARGRRKDAYGKNVLTYDRPRWILAL